MAISVILCFFFLFPSFSSTFNQPSCHPHDYSALLQFSNSFSLKHSASSECDEFLYGYGTRTIKNTSYPKTASWENVSNCCLWDGVTCDSMLGHVIGLDLSCSWLYGQLHPNNTLFQLSHLQTLNLAHNHFNGSSISPQFGDLSSLTHLNLSESVFAAEIPPKITHLSKLTSLDLSWNGELKLKPSTWEKLILNMTDIRELVLDYIDMSSITLSSLSLLMNLSSTLVSLRLQYTKLQGNITSDILCLQNLQQLDLSSNENLKIQLPMSNWSSALRYLDLSYIYFSRQVPNFIGHLKYLKHLNLHYCGFEGPIPLGFRNLTQLTYLNLGSNKFSGEISFLLNLEHLTYLDISNTSFFDEIIPNVFGNLSKLESLSLSENKLAGPIPNYICKLSSLASLDLSYNFLNGTIPDDCYSSPSLDALRLNDNHLIGPISQFLNYSLKYVDLSNNKLEGQFPESIFSLTNLSVLILSSNNLSGLVYFHKFSKLQNLCELDLSNNEFLSLNFDENVDYTITSLYFLTLSSCNINSFPKFIGKLQNLLYLNLSSNNIHGKIPDWFSNVGNGSLRYLDLSHNNLTSVECLSKMMNLNYLDLSFNLLQGNFPDWFNHVGNGSSVEQFLMRNILILDLSFNMLRGNISSSLCKASSLEILNLSHNNLSGPIPQCLVGLPHLSILDLQKNNLVGSMPGNISKNNRLQTVHLNNNQLEGPLPRSFANCNQLQILEVGYNKIEDTFPYWLEGLPELQVLVLRDNKFNGAIASSNTIHPFSRLRIFDISNNHFIGSLPTAYIREFKEMMKIDNAAVGLQYMKIENYSSPYSSSYTESVMVTWKGNDIELQGILTTFTTIDLSNNMFDGKIPEVIGDLYSLRGLNISHNRINGSIPPSMGNLMSLESLDLSCNKLVGEIPPSLTNLTFLAILNLSQNQLEGIIPKGKQFDTFQIDSYKGNLGLCGVPLLERCNSDEGESPPPSLSTFNFDEKFEFGWKPVALGYGCGMLFGMIIGYIVFSTGKPHWLVKTFYGKST